MKFDTSTIEGFENLSAEEKLSKLLDAELPDPVDMTKYVEKSVFDKKASEAADLSKQLKDKMSDDEKKKAEQDKAWEDMKTELETLRRDKTVSEYTAKFIALGYEKDLAEETAKAMAEGNMSKVFENGEKYKKAMEEKMKKDLLNNTPKPDGSGGGDKTDPAVAKAKELAKAKAGNSSYSEIMEKYKK